MRIMYIQSIFSESIIFPVYYINFASSLVAIQSYGFIGHFRDAKAYF